MTYDVVALVRGAPDVRALVDSMVDAGPELKVASAGEGAVVRLTDDSGRSLLAIEAAQKVEVPDEVVRLLGARAAADMPDPCWWVEARAPGAGDDAADLAHRFADSLCGRLGGTVWPQRAAATPAPSAPAAGEADGGRG
ncbi:hypothetical protein [Streptomonospora wellingtoniae]|uniref:Uncharacterized protein n=1 Tax=Streptomonospora wellingtoniae TaxID=3075544 RepID=A0ABU2KY30_9ACTN|nr:hypothetical protein [Streptomonospora sp. DSM 45055]MDT0304220.1 hypothetical protein [Streptomonospora sp. DSM 45055]